MNGLLEDRSTYVPLKSDPTEAVNTKYNKKIKELLKDNKELIKKFTSLSPSLPYMYGLVKTHKPGNPVRPIVSSVGSATYRLSKWLVKILNPLIGTISSSHIKNNVDLVDKLSRVQLGYNFKLISFDVVSLFTKVPVDDLLEFLAEELDKHTLPLPTHTILELIKLCIKECKFQFNDRFYAQQFGMSMGNPLSPLLSNLYMEFFESKVLCDILPSNIKWYRYVDDILCLWPVDKDENVFLNNLNCLVDSIKFTLETETENVLAFLDCNIHRDGNILKFSIYRKPTNVCSYIHYYSSHHDKVKRSVFLSMFLRALRICDPEFIDDELNNIYDIGYKLQYPKHFLDSAYNLARKTFYNVQPKETFVNKNLLVLPYCENLLNVPVLLKNFNVNVVFSNNNTIKGSLIKNSVTAQKGCVYNIPCKECDQFYIGQTGKALSVRIKQHKNSVRYGQESNAIFVHFRDLDHQIDWNNAKVVTHNNSIIDRNIVESSIIKHSRNINMNQNVGLYKLDNFISKKIVNMFSQNNDLIKMISSLERD